MPSIAGMALDHLLGESGTAADAVARPVASASTRCSLASSRVDVTSGKKSAPRRKKGICKFATWNVRSLLNESGPVETALVGSSRSSKKLDDRRVDVAVNELRRLDVEVAGFQETRWFGTGTYQVGDAVETITKRWRGCSPW